MTTLRIEHAIHDYDQWKAAFDSFAQVRADAGVRGYAIRLPVEDQRCLMLDLEFDDPDAARGFVQFLEQKVWSSADSAPALAGVPRTRLLELRGAD
ncbi:hypothetical protein [Cellulomonas sp. WB94]|uniref:hypothetical protein n=1 Tax=Cellulomonas sp. WB94 TaxID=2173174 RepID=UPI0011B2038F|nr:hypothetical protein [Cellulomonas sp. WB94]